MAALIRLLPGKLRVNRLVTLTWTGTAGCAGQLCGTHVRWLLAGRAPSAAGGRAEWSAPELAEVAEAINGAAGDCKQRINSG